MTAKKNERRRMASQLRKGMEVRLQDGDWVAITEHWYFTSPFRVVSITVANGDKYSVAPREYVMSREVEE